MFHLPLSPIKHNRALLVGGIWAKLLAEVVSHLLSLYFGTMYPEQSSAHPPV